MVTICTVLVFEIGGAHSQVRVRTIDSKKLTKYDLIFRILKKWNVEMSTWFSEIQKYHTKLRSTISWADFSFQLKSHALNFSQNRGAECRNPLEPSDGENDKFGESRTEISKHPQVKGSDWGAINFKFHARLKIFGRKVYKIYVAVYLGDLIQSYHYRGRDVERSILKLKRMGGGLAVNWGGDIGVTKHEGKDVKQDK